MFKGFGSVADLTGGCNELYLGTFHMRGTCRDVHFPYLILSLPRLQAFCREKTGNSEHFISSGENAFFKGLMVDLLPRSRGGLEGSGSALANQRT
ncbi:MAG: hypothetical protein WBF93_18175, partial [Pirellulales bacterium]